MYLLPKYIAFFVVLAFVISMVTDTTLMMVGKEDFRSATEKSAEKAMVDHIDWANLRVGQPPLLLDTIKHKDKAGNTTTLNIKNTVLENMRLSVDFNTSSVNAEIYTNANPPIVGIVSSSTYSSKFLSLVNSELPTTSTAIEEDVPVPTRAIEIYESYLENDPYTLYKQSYEIK